MPVAAGIVVVFMGNHFSDNNPFGGFATRLRPRRCGTVVAIALFYL
jgi:hypothetical protein